MSADFPKSSKLTPNSIRRPEGDKLILEKADDGIYVAVNAYDGHYEYFQGRTLEDCKVSERNAHSDEVDRLNRELRDVHLSITRMKAQRDEWRNEALNQMERAERAEALLKRIAQ